MSRRTRQAVDTATFDLFAPPGSAVVPGPAPLDAQTILALLRLWADAGVLRHLDVALAAFVQAQDAKAPPCVLVATALLAHMEGRGHSCLPLQPLVRAPATLLGWAGADLEALQLLWQRLPDDPAHWLSALSASRAVRVQQDRPDTGQPLVLAQPDGGPALLYLRRYWGHEQRVAAGIVLRGEMRWDSLGAHAAVDEPQARHWLDRLFPAVVTEGAAPERVDWQKVACAVALRGRLAVITGGPGTGKTYTAARLLALLFATAEVPDQLRVALAAPTGKAAARLKQSIDGALGALKGQMGLALDLDALVQRVGAARTLHALLGARPDTRHFQHHAGHPLDVDVLIVDEASMVHLEMMSALLDALPVGARLVLLGDKDQLASVEAGAVLGDLCRDAAQGRYGEDTVDYVQRVAGETLPANFREAGPGPRLAQQTVMLRESRRFGGPIGQLAHAVNAGHADQALALLHAERQAHGEAAEVAMDASGQLPQVVALALQGRGGAPGYVAYAQRLGEWAQVQAAQNLEVAHGDWVRGVLTAFERFRLLCAVREGDWGVAGLNQAVERALERQGWLRRGGEWYLGRPVMVTRNDPALGVFNGDIGIALPSAAAGHALRVYFLDGDQLRSVGVTRLAQVETAFAMTVHKSQGSEFEHTALVLPAQGAGVLGRELLYTGITRARRHFTLLAERPGLLEQAVASPTRRASGLPWALEGRLGGPDEAGGAA